MLTPVALKVCVAPKLPGQVELRVDHVDGDDLAGRDQHRAEDGREADATAADHQHGGTGLDRRGVEHRADTGHDGAPDQRRDVEGQAAVDADGARLGHDGLLAERAEPAHRVDRLVAAPPPRLAVAEQVVRPARQLAQHVAAAQALRAGAAVGRPRQHHVVADLERLDAGPDLLDDAGALVAEHLRVPPRPLALHDVEIAVADAGGGHADPHLAGARVGQAQALQLEAVAAVPHRRRDLGHLTLRVACPGAYDQRSALISR